jgi:hypothetical protein
LVGTDLNLLFIANVTGVIFRAGLQIHLIGHRLVRGHTELLEEPHEKAHIDYDFVAIVRTQTSITTASAGL